MSIEEPGSTRDTILDAAWDLMVEQGTGVSMRAIAAAAGLSRQTVYIHFRTRGGLLLGLVQRADVRFGIFEAFERALQVSDPRARLEATIDAWFDFVRRIHPVAGDLIRFRDSDPDAAAAWDGRMAALREALLELTSSLERDGALASDWSPEAAAAHLWVTTSVQVYGLMTGDLGWNEATASACAKLGATRSLLVG